MGHESLSSNTSGESNTAIGAEALNQNVTGNWNTATGYQSLFQSTGDNNVAFGFQAGKNLTSGQNNVFIGYDADAGNTNTSSTNSIVIGAGAVTVVGDNSFLIGNDNIESTFFKGNAYFKPGRNVSVTTFNGAGGSLTVGGQVTVSGNSELKRWIYLEFMDLLRQVRITILSLHHEEPMAKYCPCLLHQVSLNGLHLLKVQTHHGAHLLEIFIDLLVM